MAASLASQCPTDCSERANSDSGGTPSEPRKLRRRRLGGDRKLLGRRGNLDRHAAKTLKYLRRRRDIAPHQSASHRQGLPGTPDSKLAPVQTRKAPALGRESARHGKRGRFAQRRRRRKVSAQNKRIDPRGERPHGPQGAVRLAQILAYRSKTALEEALLLITEQLGFRYSCSAAASLSRAARPTNSGSIIFQFTGHRYSPIVTGISCPVACAVSPCRRSPFTLEKNRGAAMARARQGERIRARDGGFCSSAGLAGNGASPASLGPRRLRSRAPHSRDPADCPARRVRHSLQRRRASPGAVPTGSGCCASLRRSQQASQRTARANV